MIHRNDDWRMYANCATTDPDLFFPKEGDSPKPAISVCQSCTVRIQCLQDALAEPQQKGVRAGMTARDRHLLKMGRAA